MNAVCSSRGRLCRATVVAPWAALVCILGLANAAPAQGAVAELGHPDFKRRAAASSDLLELGELAYSALLEAVKHSDPEVVRRADELLAKLRQDVPAEHLQVREHDVVHTADAKNSGRITT